MSFSLVTSADYHQAAECLPGYARGRQCVPTCLMFLVTAKYVKPPANFCPEDLHDVMFAGSFLYCALSPSEQHHGLIDPENLPKRISYSRKTVNVRHVRCLSGFLESSTLTDGQNCYTLENAFTLVSAESSHCIVVFCGVSVGLHFDGSVFYVFDSHSRDELGMCASHGTCVLGKIESLQMLCTHLRSLAISLGQDLLHCIQFDLHAFRFSTYFQAFPVVHILSCRRGFSIGQSKRKVPVDSVASTPHSTDKQKRLLESVKCKNLTCMIDDVHTKQEGSQLEVLDTLQCCVGNKSAVYSPISLAFHKLVSRGPDYVCSCCTQTFFRQFVVSASCCAKGTAMVHSGRKYLTGYFSVDNKEWLCKTCWHSIKIAKTPKFWIGNGLRFPDLPEELKLSNLEERLVSPRLPFMQLREMPRGGQVSLKGNVVNVPADVNSTIKSLPRMIDDCETIMLKLKRKLSYKHHVAFENIRPNKVFEAAKWLVENSSLFRNEGIVVNEAWLESSHSLSFPEEPADGIPVNEQETSSDDWTEDDSIQNRLTGNQDTFLQSADFREFNQVLCVAPGENNTPVGLFQDIQSEILSFPTIFCGQKRIDNTDRCVPLHYSEICKWELRNVDRRVALCVPNIFFKLKRLQIKQLRDKVTLAIRKCKTKGQSLTAGDILSPGFIDRLTMQNDGYRVLRTLRGSPPYWEQAKRDVFAMIRQLGIPTWFCSFSAAETKWVPLLKSLSKLVNRKDLSTEEVRSLSWQEKSSLIKSDPVTCARYFDHRVQTFISHVLKHATQPVGEISDYFYRVEFQQRGSPHIHMLIWVENAPTHSSTAHDAICSFVDKYVTCSKHGTDPALINYQTHRHAKTCRKQGKLVCRFNFPLPPMPRTMILYPLKAENAKENKESYGKVIASLDELCQSGSDLSFDDFLHYLNMTLPDYLVLVRSTIDAPKVFLKRSVLESRINSYNKLLLDSWEANMDIQYIIDPYACVSYIVSYIAKGQRGLSNLLHDACSQAQQFDSDIRQQVRRIGNTFLSSVEIGAQEAVYLALQMPLRRSTRDVVYVDTKMEDDRTSLLKSFADLQSLPKSSTNVEMDNVLKRYKRRPKILESVCYADFASWYGTCTPKDKTTPKTPCLAPELPEAVYEFDREDNLDEDHDILVGSVIKFPCGTRMKKRKRQKVIYSQCTSINANSEEHYREKIMLFTHWRNEVTDLLHGCDSFEDSYAINMPEISSNKQKYEKIDTGFWEHLSDSDETSNAVVHPECQHEELIDAEEGMCPSDLYGCFNPGEADLGDFDVYDIGEDLGISRKHLATDILPHQEMANDKYIELIRSLNLEQKKFFYYILHRVKANILPFYTFLTGGAGVGKSVVVRALYQALVKYFGHVHEETPDTVKLLLCAPTGKAAHNIGGCTVHSAFGIPVSQGFRFKPLDMQQLNTLRSRFIDLKIVVIDEISMVGRGMFNFINLRLQEIMGSTKPFGGISVLAVGDLFQIKPVLDSWLFSQVCRNAQLQSLAGNVWVDLFDCFELHEVMRQKDDHAFALLLNRLREGKHTKEDLELLKKRQVQPAAHWKIKQLPHIFCRRVDVEQHNNSLLSDMDSSDLIQIEAVDAVSGDLSPGLRNSVLSHIPADPNRTLGLQKLLTLGIGLPAEICLNIDIHDGLTNGASCRIKKFDFRVKNSGRCSIVWVLFDDQTIGKKWRMKYKHLFLECIPKTWTPVLETCRKFTFQYHKTYVIVRRQFPLLLSSGKTIHKAQGSTMKAAVMHFGSRKIDHLHYVGLSRVTSLSGVHILHLNSEKISVSPDVVAEMKRLRTECQLLELLPSLDQWNQHELKICFQNCRSLNAHIADIRQEYNLLRADVLGFAETRLSAPLDRRFDLEGFCVLSSTSLECRHGIAVYHKLDIPVHSFKACTIADIECAVILVHNLAIVFVYCPPQKSTLHNYTCFLRHIFQSVSIESKIVLIGDFNYNYKQKDTVSQVFTNMPHLQQLIDTVTTDYHSTLDHIYTTLDKHYVKCSGTLESYYSDHKPLFLILSFQEKTFLEQLQGNEENGISSC